MATVATALAFTRSYVPFERPPQDQTLWTAIPRGLLSGIVNNETLDAKPVNDDQTLTCTMTLPPNFGYVMADAQLNVFQNRAADWGSNCNLELTNFYRGAPGDLTSFAIDYRQDFLTNGFVPSRCLSLSQPWPTYPIIGISQQAPVIIVLSAFNGTDTVATAGTVSAFASFWQFDLEQIRKHPINSPTPVHAR